MNDSTTIIKRARLIQDPRSRQVGDKTLVEIAVAYNTYGGKAKERYVPSYIVNCTVSGAAGERIAQLKKGDTVTVVGTVEEREYKGKIYKDMPFADVTIQKAAFLEETRGNDGTQADEAPPERSKAGRGTAPVQSKGTESNPFADDDLPY